MSFDIASISTGKQVKPPRIVLFGVEGIGKSTFAAGAPNPIFINMEDGLGSIDTASFPLATSSADVMKAISTLYNEEHDFQTVVLDSADWLECVLQDEINAKYSVQDLSYGKGALILADKWREVLAGLDALRNGRNMSVIMLAHSEIKRFEAPESDPYDRYVLKLQTRSSAVVREWCDALLFANQKTIIKRTEGKGFSGDHVRGISTGQRVMFTSEMPAYQAKNRYSLPAELPLSWEAFAANF